jgi:hypothetical protein
LEICQKLGRILLFFELIEKNGRRIFLEMPKQQVGSDDVETETERMAEPKKNTFFLSRAITLQVLFGNL